MDEKKLRELHIIKVKPWKLLLASVNKWFPKYGTANTDDFSQTNLGKYTEDVEDVFQHKPFGDICRMDILNSANMNSKRFSWLLI